MFKVRDSKVLGALRSIVYIQLKIQLYAEYFVQNCRSIQSLCFFSPEANFRNSSCGTPLKNLSMPINASTPFWRSKISLSGPRISSLIFSKLVWLRCVPNRSSTSANTFFKKPSESSFFPDGAVITLFTNPVFSSSSQVIRLPMISASFAFEMPNRSTNVRDAPPSATSPRDENGVRRKVCGAA